MATQRPQITFKWIKKPWAIINTHTLSLTHYFTNTHTHSHTIITQTHLSICLSFSHTYIHIHHTHFLSHTPMYTHKDRVLFRSITKREEFTREVSLFMPLWADYINILRKAFTLEDPKSVKRLDGLAVFFTLLDLWSLRIKALRKMLIKFTLSLSLFCCFCLMLRKEKVVVKSERES